MRYGILGPLAVADSSGTDRMPSAPQVRTLLAALLIRANQPVPVRDLVDEIWPAGPPASARVIVQMYVSRLPRALCPGVPAGAAVQLIRTARDGYLLVVADGELDQDRFLGGAAEARGALARGDVAAAGERYAAALASWRGPALDDVACGPALAAHARWLGEHRLVTLERRIHTDLLLGRHQAVVAELAALVERDPTREAFAGQLMTALHHAGRRAEALAVYRRVREALVVTVGVEPGAALRDRFAEILAAEDGPPPAPAPVRVELPPLVADFTGRTALVADALAALEPAGTAPPVLVLAGQGGVGKTTVAVRAAQLLRDRFPDGQLLADLRGQGGEPVNPAEVLGRFLTVLGMERPAVPDDPRERQRLFRSRTADRRLLVLLDDATAESQVRPLLPAGPGCAVLVTARSRLLGLEGARTLEVGVLPPAEALDLLASVAGPARVAAEPAAGRELVTLCGGLPLALRIAGARIAARPHQRLSEVAARLGDERRRLSELRAGDLDMRAAVEVSYRACAPAARRALRLLGLMDSAELAAWAAAALLDVDTATAEDLLEGLVDAQLLQVTGRDALGQARYRPHVLIRLFAAEQAWAHAGEDPPEQALRRVLAGYRDLSAVADRQLAASRFPPGPAAGDAGWRPDPELVRRVERDPAGWRAAEADTLALAARLAFDRRWWELAWSLADVYAGLAEVCPAREDAKQVAVRGLVAARRAGDTRAEAVSLCRLGDLHWEHGRIARAARCYARSRRLFTELGDPAGLGRVLAAQADLDVERGEIAGAREALDRGLALLRDAGDARDLAAVLRQAGLLLFDLGEFGAATDRFAEALALARVAGDARREASVAKPYADVLRWCGRYAEAGALLDRALRICRRIGDRHGEAHALRSLGELARWTGRLDEAGDLLAASGELFDRLGHRHALAYTVRCQGELRRQRGDHAAAAEAFAESMAVFVALDDRRGQAYALLSTGTLEAALGRPGPAERALRGAVRILDRLGLTLWHREAQAALAAVTGPPAGTVPLSRDPTRPVPAPV
ncbi:MAG: BTAD domain-containing putative transcriptional regulator [Mycobacteriales bacterium]